MRIFSYYSNLKLIEAIYAVYVEASLDKDKNEE